MPKAKPKKAPVGTDTLENLRRQYTRMVEVNAENRKDIECPHCHTAIPGKDAVTSEDGQLFNLGLKLLEAERKMLGDKHGSAFESDTLGIADDDLGPSPMKDPDGTLADDPFEEDIPN